LSEIIDVIKRVVSKSVFYNSDVYQNATTIKELPVLSKEEVFNHYREILVSDSSVFFTETSGSTGMPLKVAWNKSESYRSLSYLWKLRRKHNIKPTDFFLTCHTGFYHNSQLVSLPVIVTTNSISLSKVCYSEDVLEHYKEQVEKFAPKWIFAQPSFVYYFGQYISKNAPELASSIRYIELVGELLLPEIRSEISSFFPNASVVNMYGMQEFNGIFYEENGVFRIIRDNVFVEIINENGEECSYGEEGDIVVTGLVNSHFPLIRYKTGDRGKRFASGDDDAYVITVGRSNDLFSHNGKLYDGSLFFMVINEYNLSHKQPISRFQVVHKNDTLFFHLFSLDSLPSEHCIESDLMEIMKSICDIVIDIVVIIQKFDGIITSGNKIKYFISEQKTYERY